MKDPRYVVVFGACLTQFAVIGLLFTVGLFFKSFETEFGWSRTLLSACTALGFFMMGALAAFWGRMNDRFGPRKVIAVAGVLYGFGYALISQVTEAWQILAIFGTFIAIGLGAHDVVTLSTIARWFERKRGIMSGVVKVGTAIGQMAVQPIAALLIISVGWRQTVVVIGFAAIVLLLISAFCMRFPPESEVQTGSSEAKTGLTFAQARKSRVFWTLCAIQFLFFPALMTMPLHLPVHGMDLGMTPVAAAGLLSVIGGASIAGRLTVETLVDKIGVGAMR